MLGLLAHDCALHGSLDRVAFLLQELLHVILLKDVDRQACVAESFLGRESCHVFVDKELVQYH